LPFVGIDGYVKNENLITTVGNQEMVFQMVNSGFGIAYSIEKFLEFNHPNAQIKKFSVDGINIPKSSLTLIFDDKLLAKVCHVFLKDMKFHLLDHSRV